MLVNTPLAVADTSLGPQVDHQPPSVDQGRATTSTLDGVEPRVTPSSLRNDAPHGSRPALLQAMRCPANNQLMEKAGLASTGYTFDIGPQGVLLESLPGGIENKALQHAIARHQAGDPEWHEAITCTFLADLSPVPVHLVPGEGATPIQCWRVYDAHAARRWFKNHNTSPASGEVMQGIWHMRPDFALQKLSLACMAEQPPEAETHYPTNLVFRPQAPPHRRAIAPARPPQVWQPFNHTQQVARGAVLSLVLGALSAGMAVAVAVLDQQIHNQNQFYYEAPPAAVHWDWASYGGIMGIGVGVVASSFEHFRRASRHPPSPAPAPVTELTEVVVV